MKTPTTLPEKSVGSELLLRAAGGVVWGDAKRQPRLGCQTPALPRWLINLLSYAALLACFLADAGQITLTWDPNPESDLAGYRVYFGSASRGYTNLVDSGRSNTNTVTGLVDGATYFFSVTAYNTNGLESDYSNEVQLTVSNGTPPTPIPPSVALTGVTAGATYTVPTTLNLGATVVANGNTVTKVQFLNGATVLGEDSAAPYALVVSNPAASAYSVAARVFYGTASTLDSVSVSFSVVNPPPPTIALSGVTSGQSVTAPATVNLGATVTANGNTITKVQFLNGATVLGEDASSPYAYAWSGVSAGSYSLSAKVVYGTGQTVTSTVASLTVTNPPPAIALSGVTSGQSVTAPATVNLGATVTANGNTITKVQFLNGATVLGEDASSPYAYAWSGVSAGSYSLSAKVVYGSGQTVTSSVASLTVTNPPPTIALGGVTNGQRFVAPATMNLSAAVGANGNSISKVQFLNGSTVLGEATATPYEFVSGKLSAGNYDLRARVFYGAAQTKDSAAVSVTVTNPPPVLVLSVPTPTEGHVSPATVELTAGLTANGNTITKVQFFNGATLLGEDTNIPYSYTWSSVGAGSFSLKARAHYDGGQTVDSTVTALNVRFPAPTLVLSVPAAKGLTAPASVTLAATVNANGNAITKVQFLNGATLLGEDTTLPYSYTWSSVAAGSFNLSARVIYGAGESVNSDIVPLTVINPPPTIALTVPVPAEGHVAPATLELSASVDSQGNTIAKVEFFDGATLLGEDTTLPYSYTLSSAGAGSCHLMARVTDTDGRSADSEVIEVVISSLPAPWKAIEVGDTLAGSAQVTNGVFEIKGSGKLGGTTDAYRFVYQPLSGDGEMVVKVNAIANPGAEGQVGIMIRDNLSPNAPFVFMGVGSDGIYRILRRESSGSGVISKTSIKCTPTSTWLRVRRSGASLIGYRSADGKAWTQIGSFKFPMATSAYLGFAVSSGDLSVLGTTSYSNVLAIP